MAKKLSARTSELNLILERLDALEERIKRLEGESDAAVAVAADFAVALAAPAGPGAPGEPTRPPAPSGVPGPTPSVAPGLPAPAEEPSEEVLLVLSAAVAAFLGERAHLRQARLVHSDAWAQQGRVSVMASHRWAVHR